ncbi:MAG: sporulation protein YunB [Bacillota bacterium]
MYRRRGKVRYFNSLTKIIILLCVCIFLFFMLVEIGIRPTIRSVAETQAQWTANEAIHKAILEEIAMDVRYTDLILPHKDKDDRVVFMQANIMAVNKLASESVLKIQHQLEDMRREVFYIPLGQIIGSELFADYGPRIKFRMLPIGTVRVQISDDFSQAGINQTRHRIFLNVSSEMKIIFPLINTQTVVETRVPIADTIIVGPVPDTYMLLDIGAQATLSDINQL